jgi:phosphoglycolate phosphatase-like HAD superfamily hydrolase
MIRVVVFDFDGTLADTNTVKEDCLHRTVAGLPGGPDALMAARRTGGDRYKLFTAVARRLAPAGDPPAVQAQARALVEAYSNCCTKGILAAAERRGARESIDKLRRRGLRIYVLSATPDRHLHGVLRRRGLLSRVNGILGSSVTKEQGLLKIMVRERVARDALLLVGDSADDQRAAHAIGVKFAAVTAENRIGGRGRFAMRDLRPLVPLIDSLNTRRASYGA